MVTERQSITPTPATYVNRRPRWIRHRQPVRRLPNWRSQVARPTLRWYSVKSVAKAFGATVNDVLIAAVSGAIRRYLLESAEQALDPIDSLRAD